MQSDYLTASDRLRHSVKPFAAALKKKRASAEITSLIVRVSLVVVIAAFFTLYYSKTSDAVEASVFDEPVRITADQMAVLVKELLSSEQQIHLAADDQRRKDFAARIKELIAFGQAAESAGLANSAEVKLQIDMQANAALRDTYEKKNPGALPTDAETNDYYQAHPGEWEAFLNANPAFKPVAQEPQGEGIKKEYGQIRLLAERARKAGLDQDEATKLRILLGRSQVLARVFVAQVREKTDKLVTEAHIEAYYNSHKREFEEVRARHILISTQEGPSDDDTIPAKKPRSKEEARKKAQSLLDRIRKGEDFARLAQRNSDDPISKANGGNLDFFPKGVMVQPFDDTAFVLKPGQVSDVFETDFGFHILKVEERRIAPVSNPSTHKNILEKLQLESLKKEMERVVASSKVEVAEDFHVEIVTETKPKTDK